MLIIQRGPGEALMIGDDVTVYVLETGRGGLRIGIEAPPEVNIAREELLEPVGPGFEPEGE